MQTRLFAMLAVLTLFVFAGAGHAGDFRTWNSRKGTSVEARFDRVSGNYIILQKSDGALVKIEYSSLSDSDQAHLRANSQPSPDFTTASQSVAQGAPGRVARPSVPHRQWPHEEARQQGVDVRQQDAGIRWQEPDEDVLAPRLNRGARPDDDEQLHLDPSGQNHNAPFRQRNLQNQQFGNQEPERDPLSDSRMQQAEQDRWAKQQGQDRIRRDKQELESEAWRLQNSIRNSEYDSRFDYSGLSRKANQLSQDADRLGEHDASSQFRRAASSLRDAESEQSSRHTHNSTFGSRENEEREEAQRNVGSGRGSINTFNSGSSFNHGSSFNNGTSMDSW